MEYNPPVTYDDPESSLWQRWWVVALVTLLTLAAAGAWVHTRTPVYEATASVHVHPLGTEDTVSIETEAELVRSTSVATGAAQRLRDGLDPTALAEQVTVVAPANSEVLQITYAGRSPEQARVGSHAFASAYLHHREETAQAELSERVATIEAKREELDGTLRELNERVALLPLGSPELGGLENERAAVTGHRDTLTERLNELATAPVSAGIIISDAALPTAPVGPAAWVVLASGGALGLALGLGLALLLQRSRRTMGGEDLSFAAPFLGGSLAAEPTEPAGSGPAPAPAPDPQAHPTEQFRIIQVSPPSFERPSFERPSFERPSFEPRSADRPSAGAAVPLAGPPPPAPAGPPPGSPITPPATASVTQSVTPSLTSPATPPVAPPRFAVTPVAPHRRGEPRLADAPRFGPTAGREADRTARRELAGRPLRLGRDTFPDSADPAGPAGPRAFADTETSTERLAGPPAQRAPEPEVLPPVTVEVQTVAMPRLDDDLLRALDTVGREHRRPR